MKLLYLSCHSIIEYDEVKLFKELGIDVFAHGAYLDPKRPEDDKRPSLTGETDLELIDMARRNPKEKMTKEFLDKFDVIFFHWMPAWLEANFELIKNKLVIFRTNGQSSPDDEILLGRYKARGVKIVRYSPIEKNIPYYCGADDVIRFGKDPEEYKGWTGEKERVITVCQNMKARAAFCNYEVFEKATEGFDRKLFGPDNEASGELSGGCLSYDDLKKELRENRVYFYTGTKPASYTLNFIEAWMTGIPIVSIGSALGDPHFLPGQKTFEIPFLGKSGQDFFVSDDVAHLRGFIKNLMMRPELRQEISECGRLRAIELFGIDKIREEWRKFFVEQGVLS